MSPLFNRSPLGYGMVVCLMAGLWLMACRKDPDAGQPDPRDYNPDWTEASHGSDQADTARIFPEQTVNRLDLKLRPDQWIRITQDMQSNFGIGFGTGASAGQPARDPLYVDADLQFQGKRWRNVGFRLKGKGELGDIWSLGRYKLPFRLNFDRFEDSVPAIRNQHFYGYRELSFSPGYRDASLLHEKMASYLFRASGIPAARAAYYRVYVDIGQGPRYWGLYTALELPDDHQLEETLGEISGNLYEPSSALTSFSSTSFVQLNRRSTSTDTRDAETLISVLNSPIRTGQPDTWKQQLEQELDLPVFLNWLAVNNAIVNPDSYGVRATNYYLYRHSTRGFVWVPTDANEAFMGEPGLVGPPGGGSEGLSLSMNEVTANFPLIRFLIDDPAYMALYRNYLRRFRDNLFQPAALHLRIDGYARTIAPYVNGAEGEQPGYTLLGQPADFDAGVSDLKQHVVRRHTLLGQYLP